MFKFIIALFCSTAFAQTINLPPTGGSGSGITALTGDVTATGPGSAAATVAAIMGTTVDGTTGTVNVVFSASPTITGALQINTVGPSGYLTLLNTGNGGTVKYSYNNHWLETFYDGVEFKSVDDAGYAYWSFSNRSGIPVDSFYGSANTPIFQINGNTINLYDETNVNALQIVSTSTGGISSNGVSTIQTPVTGAGANNDIAISTANGSGNITFSTNGGSDLIVLDASALIHIESATTYVPNAYLEDNSDIPSLDPNARLAYYPNGSAGSSGSTAIDYSTNGHVKIGGLLNIPVQTLGNTPTAISSGDVTFTSTFILCVWTGSAWKETYSLATTCTF